MKKVLITGVGGLIGNNFARYLLKKGYNVIGVDNLFGSYKENLPKELLQNNKFYEIDLLDIDSVNYIFLTEKPDVVFHFAAYAALGLSPFVRNFTYSNNILTTINVVNCCINNDVKKLIFTSSMDVYGNGNPPFKETDIPLPIDSYGISKYAAELDIKDAYERFGLNYTIIRPHNVIGRYQNIWDKYRNVLGIWIRQILNNEPITIYGDGSVKRAFSDVNYMLKPMEIFIDNHNNEIFNIGSDKVYSLYEAANILVNIGESFGFNPSIKYLEPRNEVKEAYVNHDKAKEILNFVDGTDLEKVLHSMFEWAMTQPNRIVKQMPYEINKNIYSFWKKK